MALTSASVESIARNWRGLAVRGAVAILFGIAAIVWPGITLLALVLLFAAHALLEGISAIVTGVKARWTWMVAVGVLSVVFGVLAALLPGITAVALVWLVALWAVSRGVVEIVSAIQLRKVIRNEWAIALAGALSIAFGVVLFLFPGAGALSLVWLIAAFVIAFGFLELTAAIRLRAAGHPGAHGVAPPQPA